MFTFGSLFAGIGGMDLGLERAGMQIEWMVEIDPFCQKVLAHHWPDVPKYGDVRDVGKRNLEPVDLICGGFPCQPHSVAGKRKGAADDRNLWPEFIRIVREMRPRYVIAENVPGIVTTHLDTVLSDLESEAYTCWTFNIPACAFDAPHRRERIFVVAHRNGRGVEGRGPYTTDEAEGAIWRNDGKRGGGHDGGYTLSSEDVAHADSSDRFGRGGNVQVGRIGGEEEVATNGDEQRVQRNPQSHLGMLAHGISPGLAGRWLPEPPIGRIAPGIPGLNARLRALGNAVVPQVTQWIGERIMEVEANET